MLCTKCQVIFSEPRSLGTLYHFDPGLNVPRPQSPINDGQPRDDTLTDLINAAADEHCFICPTRYNALLRFKDVKGSGWQDYLTQGLRTEYNVRPKGQPSPRNRDRTVNRRSDCNDVEDALSINSPNPVIGTPGQHESKTKKSALEPCFGLILEFGDYLGEDTSVSFDMSMIEDSSASFYLPSSSNTGSDEALGLCQQWLRDCTQNHSTCQQPSRTSNEDAAFYPTRLLDLEPENARPGHVQLCCRNETHFTGQYATLSHRWGSYQPKKLQASTLKSFREGLLVDELPKNFRECVTVTQQLGIRYLWIDSLCIIQPVPGDSKDWEAESATMGDVYQHSTINIAATAAEHCDGGLFRDRDPAGIGATIELAGSWCRGVKGGTYALSNLWKDELESSPLLQRGWVFQERILAKRMLHFGQSQIIWECGELRASETLPKGRIDNARDVDDNSKTMLTKLKHYKELIDSKVIPLGPKLIDRGYYHRAWIHSVFGCNLAKEEDKLVALSGLASKVAAFLGPRDAYLAGHWQQSLPHSLLWFIIHSFIPTAKLTRPAHTFRAPSWSWASIDGQIQFHPDFYSGYDLVNIKEASPTLLAPEYPHP